MMALRRVRVQGVQTVVVSQPLLACWSVIVKVSRQLIGQGRRVLRLGAVG